MDRVLTLGSPLQIIIYALKLLIRLYHGVGTVYSVCMCHYYQIEWLMKGFWGHGDTAPHFSDGREARM
jgi:hypothetical protein